MLDDKSVKAIEVLFKDIRKAFDWLQPSKSLIDLGVTSYKLELWMNFMQNRQQCVRVHTQKAAGKIKQENTQFAGWKGSAHRRYKMG